MYGGAQMLTLFAFIQIDDIFMDLFDCSIDCSAGSDQSPTEMTTLLWMQLVSTSGSVQLYMLETALHVLESDSLVQWKPEQNSYTMHKLAHAWAHDRLDVHEQDRFVIAALELLLNPQITSNEIRKAKFD
jgi:hypothetical protein